MTSRTGKPKRTNDPDATRARILDAAALLFHQKGYGQTSMHDVIDAASVTSGALHHHYRTKKDLGLAVIRERVAAIVDEAWIEPVLEADNPVDGITEAFKGVSRGLRRRRIAGCPLNNLALELSYIEPEFRKEIQKIFDRWQEALAKRIAKSSIRVPGLSASEIATFVIASYSGAMTMAKSSQSAEPVEIALKYLTRQWRDKRAAA